MFSKDLYGNSLGSPEYRAELTSRMSRQPVRRNDIPPMYAKINKSETRSHKCAECDKLHYEIERLEMKLDEKSSRGSRLAMLDSQESTRSRDYKHDSSEWKGSWAATPDDLSINTKGPNRQRGQYKELEADVKRLKRELHQKSLEVRMLRETKSKSSNNNGDLPSDLDAMVDPLPADKISEMYINVYKTDWTLANKALLKDKVSQEQAASKLLKILTTAFSYCDKVAPEHLEAILASTIKVKPVQGNPNIQNLPTEKVTIHQEAGLFRKCIAEKVAINVIKNFRYEVFMKMSQFTPQQKQNYDITKYVDKCVNITWYMAVQNYPIILDNSVSRDKEFDLEHYDIFQEEEPEGEETYAYLIWPALINEQNNTYLCKGVAEPTQTK